MRSFRFVIPIKFEDLLQSSGHLDVYSVQIEYNAREIPHKLIGESHLKAISLHLLLITSFQTVRTIFALMASNLFSRTSMSSTVV